MFYICLIIADGITICTSCGLPFFLLIPTNKTILILLVMLFKSATILLFMRVCECAYVCVRVCVCVYVCRCVCCMHVWVIVVHTCVCLGINIHGIYLFKGVYLKAKQKLVSEDRWKTRPLLWNGGPLLLTSLKFTYYYYFKKQQPTYQLPLPFPQHQQNNPPHFLYKIPTTIQAHAIHVISWVRSSFDLRTVLFLIQEVCVISKLMT